MSVVYSGAVQSWLLTSSTLCQQGFQCPQACFQGGDLCFLLLDNFIQPLEGCQHHAVGI